MPIVNVGPRPKLYSTIIQEFNPTRRTTKLLLMIMKQNNFKIKG